MKKNFKYALLGAIALTGAVSFSACQSSDEVVENPNYNPEDKTVKTEFVINVTQPGERTRQPASVTGNGTFQGMRNIYLLSFTAAPTTASVIESSQVHSLNDYPSSAALSGEVTNSSSKWYTLYIPTQTTNFLFYAKTVNGTPTNSAKDGKLNYSVEASPVGNIGFSLSPILSSGITEVQNTLSNFLNTIASATDWAGSVATSATNDDYKALANYYQQFTSYSANGFRQGSAKAILATVGALYGVMDGIINAGTNPVGVTNIATAVMNAIAVNFTVDGTTASFKDNTLTASTTNFPIEQGLPAGSAILKFENGAFSYTNDGTSGAATIATPLAKFTYPSELAYYCNSALRATTSDVNTSTLPSTSATWLDDDEWTGWGLSQVDGSTRAVAMKENVTFGVAQLHSTVSIGTDVTEKKFIDNAKTVTESDGIDGNEIASNQVIDLSGANDYLTVTGVVIGGQPESAGYDYLPKNGTEFDYAVYDKVPSSSSGEATEMNLVGVNTSAEYNTLVLDNYTSSSQDAVNVAIELVASKDFYGHDGLIKAGQPFYLIGAMNSSSKDTNSLIDWTKQVSFKSTDPGYDSERVFIRDAVTTANFTLTSTSLQKAYSTIPDLRSTQMVFGLSVDLKWKAGLTYNISF